MNPWVDQEHPQGSVVAAQVTALLERHTQCQVNKGNEAPEWGSEHFQRQEL